jgi:putative transposase
MEQEQARGPALAACTEAQRQQAMARFAVLRSHIEEGIPLSEVAREAAVPLRSLQRWLARYRAAGLVGLARAQRSDTGTRKLPAELVAVIEGMALRKPRPSIATMHRRITALATRAPLDATFLWQRVWDCAAFESGHGHAGAGWTCGFSGRVPELCG